MLKWAVTVRVRKGQRLLDRNPLEGVKRPHELNPRRPMASVERFYATREAIGLLLEESKEAVGRSRSLQLDMVLVLAEATGRRLGNLRQLTWKDWDFDRNTVKWRSESDKKRKEWVVPVLESLIADVKAYRVRVVTETLKQGSTLNPLMFPDADNPSRSVDRHELRTWLEIAEAKAGLDKLDGALWHAYRRGWATSRKHLPLPMLQRSVDGET